MNVSVSENVGSLILTFRISHFPFHKFLNSSKTSAPLDGLGPLRILDFGNVQLMNSLSF